MRGNRSDNTRKQLRSSRHRPPVLVITFFVLFSLLLLYFLTFRQLRNAQSDRLRLLAGFSQRVETTLEDLAGRFVRPVRDDDSEICEYLKFVPAFTILKRAHPAAISPGSYPVVLDTSGTDVYLTYRNPDPDPEAAKTELDCSQEPVDVADEQDPRPTPDYSVRIDLEELVGLLVEPGAFDSVMLATAGSREGTSRADEAPVIFQRGEPELRMTDAGPLLRGGGRRGLLPWWTEGYGRAENGNGGTEGRVSFPTTTWVTKTEIADVTYVVFVQPLALHLPHLEGLPIAEPERWLCVGVVAENALLASSFTSSPALLFIVVGVFPLILLAYPFAKLHLITKRQRYTRFDVAALVLCGLLGLSLVTFLVFGMGFLFAGQDVIDRQLVRLAETIWDGARSEIDLAARQLKDLDRDEELARKLRSQPRLADGSSNLAELLAHRRHPERRALLYPTFHSVSWIAEKTVAPAGVVYEEGEQVEKIALPRQSPLSINVGDRRYYRCANGHYEAVRPDARAMPSLGEICLEPLLSKTSGRDELVIALPSSRPDRAVAAMSLRPNALALPLLPHGFGFAVVDEAGEVLFHSDSSRNLTENFLKATNENQVLEAMLRARRKGHLHATYWGEKHRAYVYPLEDLPWALITFRSSRDLRLRTFALAHDFLNQLLLYFGMVLLCVLLCLYFVPTAVLQQLWPHSHFLGIYRATVLSSLVGMAALAAVFASRAPVLVFFASFLLPLAFCAGYFRAIYRRYRQSRHDAENTAAPGRSGSDHRWEARFYLAALAVTLVVFVLAGVAGDGGNPGFEVGGARRWLLAAALPLVGGILLLRARKRQSAGRGSTSAPEEGSEEGSGGADDGGSGRKSVLFPDGWRGMLAFLWLLPLPAAVGLGLDAPVLFLLMLNTVAVLVLEWNRHRFELRRQRRSAFLFCLTALVVIVGALPALGFAILSSWRQSELLAKDTLASLARSRQEREERIETRDLRLRPAFKARETREHVFAGRLKDDERAYLSSIFPPPDDGGVVHRFLWPPGAAEGRRRSPEWLVALLSARALPVNELTTEATGVDLSRYPLTEDEWRARIRDLTRIFEPKPPQVLASPVGFDYVATWRTGFGGGLDSRWWLFLASLALLPWVAIYLVRFVTERVLLIAVVQSGSVGEDPQGEPVQGWTLQSILQETRKAAEGERPRPQKVMLVTSIPELAIESLATQAGVASFIDIVEDDAGRKGDAGSRDAAAADPAAHEEKLAIVRHFYPELALDERGEEKFERFCDFIQRRAAEKQQSVILVSQRGPRELFDHGQSTEIRPAGNGRQRLLKERWQALLAQFTLRYGRDAGRDERSYRNEIKARLGLKLKPPRQGIEWEADLMQRKLINLLVEECGHTRRLQEVGRQVLEQIHLDSYTPEEIRSRITLLARSYYQSVWDGCSTDEKSVLVRFAEDGMVNPENFDEIVDLLDKGLVRRDPALRLMSRSFSQFVLRSVNKADIQEWEDEGGLSAWSVMKWLMPLPLLFLGSFLFLTQRESFSNAVALVVALGSVTPIFVNLYNLFREATTRTQLREETEGKG